MKKAFVLAFALTIIGVSSAFSQFTFSVSPGMTLNGAQFGYRVGAFVPYVGLDFMSVSGNLTVSGTEWDYDQDKAVTYSDKGEASASIFVPTIGAKFFFLESNKIKAYANLNVSKPFLSASASYNGKDSKEVKDALENLSLIGGSLGFGIEYYFDNNFSLGGEFGLRYFHASYDAEYDSEYYNPELDQDVPTKISTEAGLSILPTYSKLTLNYYFD